MHKAIALTTLLVLAAAVAAPAASAAPPVDVDRRSDGSVCVTISLQVTHCTPALDFVSSPPPVCVLGKYFPVCVWYGAEGPCVGISEQVPLCPLE